MIKMCRVPVTTTGSAGSATGSADSGVMSGIVLGVYLDYHASAPGTTDVTVACKNEPNLTILSIADNNTDGMYYPRVQVHDTSGTARTYDGSNAVAEPIPVSDILTVSVVQADALTDCVVAYILYEEID